MNKIIFITLITKFAYKYLPLIFLVINCLLLIYYLFFTYAYYFHSDSASKILQAKEMLENHELFSPSWNSVNNDLLILSSHYFLLPILIFLKVSYFSYAMGALLSAILTVYSISYLLNTLEVDKRKKIIILALIIGGISIINAEDLFGHFAYGNFVTYACFLVSFSIRLLNENNKSKILYLLGINLIFIIVFWSNPIRAIPTYLLPILLACLFSINKFKKNNLLQFNNKLIVIILIIGISLLGSIIGYMLFSYSIKFLPMISSPANLKWVDSVYFYTNLQRVVEYIVEIMGGWPFSGTKILSLGGLYQGVRFLGGVLFIYLAFVFYKEINKNLEEKIFFLSVFAFSSFVIMACIIISSGLIGSRYLNCSLIFILISILAYDFDKNKKINIIKALMIAILISNSFYIYTTTKPEISKRMGMYWDNQFNGITNFLIKENLNYGYSTYWRANSITVLSNEEVIIRAIEDIEGQPKPYRWLSSNRWYLPESHIGKSFILLTKEEAKKFNLQYLISNELLPIRELSYDNYIIYEFSENIAKKLPNWTM